MIPKGSEISDTILGAVRQFRTLVENGFQEKLSLQEEAAGKLVEAIGQVVRVVDGIEKSSAGLDKQIGRQLVASEGFLKIFEDRAIPQQDRFLVVAEVLKGTICSLNGRIQELEGAIANAGSRLDRATPKLEGALQVLEESATDFGAVVRDVLDPAARQHREAIKTWATGASETLDLVGKLEGAAGSVAAAAPRYAEAGEMLRQAVDGQLAPAQVALREGAETVLATIRDLSRKFGAFGEVVDSSSPAFVKFAGLVEGEFLPTANALREFRGLAGTLVVATEELRKQVVRQGEERQRLDETYRTLRDATERLAASGESFREALSGRVLPMQEALERVINQLDKASRSLEDSLNDGLRKGPDYLQSFQQQLDRLQILANAFEPLVVAGPEATRAVAELSTSIGKLAERMDSQLSPPSGSKKKWNS